MDTQKAIYRYLPMTETMYYILLSLTEPRHGYGVILYVEKITNGRIRIGAGTIYTSLSRLEKDGLIKPYAEEDRRKFFAISEIGLAVIKTEISRLKELYENGKKFEEGSI
ncbi:MAG: PadR family transcriptional regulator [Bacillota bacterium]|nr:PadR family transcriptional regulator [Bacillota bacterium]